MKADQITWPKQRRQLTEEQLSVMDDWYTHFLKNVLPGRYGWIDKFNHTYAVRTAAPGHRTLEVGPGNGSHLEFEDTASQSEYVALELRDSLSDQIDRTRHPNVRVVVGDCQAQLDFDDATFDRVLAIHVLEHLDNLPRALDEMRRVIKPSGVLSVVIPCEGGFAYGLGRRVTAQRKFEKRYGMPYEWIIRHEHVNQAWEVIHELEKRFRVEHRTYFPVRVPSVQLNVVVGLTLRPAEVRPRPARMP